MIKINKFDNQFLGLFFSSSAIFSLLVFLSPVISTLLVGMQLQLIFLSPLLGIALATTLYSLSKHIRGIQIPYYYSLFMTCLILFLFYSLVIIQKKYDLELANLLTGSRESFISDIKISSISVFRDKLQLLMAAPFLFYGLILMNTFKSSVNTLKVYKVEVIGALIGSLICIFILENLNFKSTLIFIVLNGFLSSYFFADSKAKRITSSIFLIACVILIINNIMLFEPQRNSNFAARDLSQKYNVKILDTSWTTYSKVQLLELKNQHERKFIFTLGDGTGIARVKGELENSSSLPDPLVRIVGQLKPEAKNIAVLFSGAGADLYDLNQIYNGNVRLTGVEINQNITERAKIRLGLKYLNFIESPNIQLLTMDARQFLMNDKSQYDVLLFSWSGATVAHYTSALIHTTQYSFTKEAILSAVKKVKKNGLLVIAGASKVNLLLILKELESEGVLVNLKNQVLIYSQNSNKLDEWKSSWDDLILIWKNGDIYPDDVKNLNRKYDDDYYLVHSPFQTKLPAVQSLLDSYDINSAKNALRLQSSVYFDIHTDNKPFVYQDQEPLALGTLKFWFDEISRLFKNQIDNELIRYFLIIALIIFVLLLFDLRSSHSNLFGLLSGIFGSGALILFLFRLLIFVENPTLALTLGLLASMMGTLIGILIVSNGLWSKRLLMAFGLISIVFLFFIQILHDYLLIASFLIQSIFVGLLFSIVFSNLIKSNLTKRYINIWSFDTWGAVIAAIICPIILENLGMKSLQNFLIIILILKLTLFVFVRKV